jgi:hypothetical protein
MRDYSEHMESQYINTKHSFQTKEDAVQYVSDMLTNSQSDLQLTMTIIQEKLGAYCVHTAITDLSVVTGMLPY